jgi:hypothetical protein
MESNSGTTLSTSAPSEEKTVLAAACISRSSGDNTVPLPSANVSCTRQVTVISNHITSSSNLLPDNGVTRTISATGKSVTHISKTTTLPEDALFSLLFKASTEGTTSGAKVTAQELLKLVGDQGKLKDLAAAVERWNEMHNGSSVSSDDRRNTAFSSPMEIVASLAVKDNTTSQATTSGFGKSDGKQNASGQQAKGSSHGNGSSPADIVEKAKKASADNAAPTSNTKQPQPQTAATATCKNEDKNGSSNSTRSANDKNSNSKDIDKQQPRPQSTGAKTKRQAQSDEIVVNSVKGNTVEHATQKSGDVVNKSNGSEKANKAGDVAQATVNASKKGAQQQLIKATAGTSTVDSNKQRDNPNVTSSKGTTSASAQAQGLTAARQLKFPDLPASVDAAVSASDMLNSDAAKSKHKLTATPKQLASENKQPPVVVNGHVKTNNGTIEPVSKSEKSPVPPTIIPSSSVKVSQPVTTTVPASAADKIKHSSVNPLLQNGVNTTSHTACSSVKSVSKPAQQPVASGTQGSTVDSKTAPVSNGKGLLGSAPQPAKSGDASSKVDPASVPVKPPPPVAATSTAGSVGAGNNVNNSPANANANATKLPAKPSHPKSGKPEQSASVMPTSASDATKTASPVAVVNGSPKTTGPASRSQQPQSASSVSGGTAKPLLVNGAASTQEKAKAQISHEPVGVNGTKSTATTVSSATSANKALPSLPQPAASTGHLVNGATPVVGNRAASAAANANQPPMPTTTINMKPIENKDSLKNIAAAVSFAERETLKGNRMAATQAAAARQPRVAADGLVDVVVGSADSAGSVQQCARHSEGQGRRRDSR